MIIAFAFVSLFVFYALNHRDCEFDNTLCGVVDYQLEALKSFFSKPGEMNALWNKLTRARKKQDMSIQEAWETLQKLPGTQAKKSEILWDFVVSAGDTSSWTSRIMKSSTIIDKTKKKETTTTGLYRGELERTHGKDEADDFIARGKYIKSKDEDGDEIYYKTQTKGSKSTAITERAELERSLCEIIIQTMHCFSCLIFVSKNKRNNKIQRVDT